GDRQQAIAAYENLLEFDPTFYPALNNLGIQYGTERELERSVDLYMRAAEADSSSPFPYLNAVWPQLLLGRPDEARRSLFVVDSLFPGYPYAVTYSGKLEALEGDYEAARDRFATVLERHGADLFWRAESEGLLAAVAATEGRLREYERHMQERIRANEGRGRPEEALSDAIAAGFVELGARRDTARGIATVEEALDRYPLADMPAADRPYLDLADFYAATGRLGEARELIEAYERDVTSRARGGENRLLQSRALVAVFEGRPADALALVRRSDASGCVYCPTPYYIAAYEAAGPVDSLIAARERAVEMPFLDRIYWDAATRAESLERLAELYEAKNDLERAAEYWARFVELWDEADPELQPRVEEARTRLEEIVRARG
ncbi:MAG: hypothetical protein R3266_15420, partial [Gemmatimonadota bacterium]|nr:hypothetical protein [Gemmatimonadota bacterium]